MNRDPELAMQERGDWFTDVVLLLFTPVQDIFRLCGQSRIQWRLTKGGASTSGATRNAPGTPRSLTQPRPRRADGSLNLGCE